MQKDDEMSWGWNFNSSKLLFHSNTSVLRNEESECGEIRFLKRINFTCDLQIEAEIASGGNVLVHCVAGVSRSATICLAFLTKFHCSSLRQAYHLMARKRPLVRPNIGFWRQLIAYEQVIQQIRNCVRNYL